MIDRGKEEAGIRRDLRQNGRTWDLTSAIEPGVVCFSLSFPARGRGFFFLSFFLHGWNDRRSRKGGGKFLPRLKTFIALSGCVFG